jgi:indolepyruvate decarboxylase
MVPTLLFAYGTLAPAGPGIAARKGWVSDRVRGRLYDLGRYPALIECDNAEAGWVEGYVRPVGTDELIGHLDPYEGVDEGLFRRVATTTEAGRQVWVYVYARPLPRDARGPLVRWSAVKAPGRGPDPVRIDENAES